MNFVFFVLFVSFQFQVVRTVADRESFCDRHAFQLAKQHTNQVPLTREDSNQNFEHNKLIKAAARYANLEKNGCSKQSAGEFRLYVGFRR